MAQHDYDIANADGATVRADINSVLEAIASLNSGATAPSTTFAHMWWFDTATSLLKQRNAANNGWVSVAAKDGSGWRSFFNGTELAIITQGEAETGTATTPRIWTAERVQQAIAAFSSSGNPRAYLAGLQLSNNSGDSDHDIDIAAGTCRDAANADDITLTAFTKRIDATWAAGTGAGGLSSSLTAPANNTWYHVFAINVGGSADVGFDTSVTAANLVTDHSATAYRRLGSVLTDGSANLIAFSQEGDEVLWLDPPLDVDNATPGTSANTATLSTPADVKTRALLNVMHGAAMIHVSSLDQNDEAPSVTAAPLASALGGSANNNGNFVPVRTNTSRQVRYRASSNNPARIATLGWLDARGRND